MSIRAWAGGDPRPHARGGGPRRWDELAGMLELVPTHVGVDPGGDQMPVISQNSSPRTWGWTFETSPRAAHTSARPHARGGGPFGQYVYPGGNGARPHARGGGPTDGSGNAAPSGARPHARGGGPGEGGTTVDRAAPRPHARGGGPEGNLDLGTPILLVPTHVGVDRRDARVRFGSESSSPRTWGWTVRRAGCPILSARYPAPAGDQDAARSANARSDQLAGGNRPAPGVES